MATILLVDDEPNIRKLSALVIKSLGHTVTTAQDGKEAADYIAAHPHEIDLVVSDMIMPNMSGFELCQKVRDQVPVVIVSAMSEEFKTETVFTVGAMDFIPKPFDVSFVRQRLGVLLHKLGKNADYQPEIVARYNGQPIYQGENIAINSLEGLELLVDTILEVDSEDKATLDSVIAASEVLGQTIQSRVGGVRLFKVLPELAVIQAINRTNLAVGDVTGIYIGAVPAHVVDRVL